ncbi:DEAD/DEAH box helicase [Planctomonas deserti]|uniref:DEAD/DEAH box helicase n=1 Tax=Planctomonas deserti TaxID=2144185 RepID=UPI000D35A0EE|nr:DEAD/DEAH box helicase [Planctomonas deserti]
MPKNKNGGGFRPAKNYEPSRSKSGSRSPGHRGYRPDETGGPKKQRWNADERAARREGDRPAERPSYGDRPQRSERPSYGDRPQRSERPSYGDRPQRSERPSYGDRSQRSERPSYGDRPQRSERPSYGDRPQRSERPSYGDRSERPSYGDRPQRPYGDRPQRSERPSSGDRPHRTARPSTGDHENPRRRFSEDRPQRSFDDRAPRRDAENERPRRPFDAERRGPRRSFDEDRPRRSFEGDRPRRDGDAERRGPRRSFDEDRPRRDDHRASTGDSKFYPSRDTSAPFTPNDDVVLERLEAQATTASDVEGVTFEQLGLGGNIVAQLAQLGAPSPFPIQAATIPDVLAGRDVLGRGRTGSGKTIAFGAPLVERLMENNGAKNRKMGRKPRALILAPTRELAMQIDRTVQPIARSVGLFTATIFGGVPQYRQVGALQRGVDILIATPGRLEDLIEQGRLDLREIQITVLDEADHMCDLGFLEPVQRILRQTAPGGQRLLFSATLDRAVASLVNEFLTDPAVHEVAGEDQASSTIDHRLLLIEQREKSAIIEQLVQGEGKTLIFARTRAYAEQLADQLEDAGVPATSLHGDLNQSRRTRNLQMLTSGRVKVLVATDVAARGIHVDDISLVIQADPPDEYKTYMHRSGRTGRAGKHGTVVTLVNRSRRRRMEELLDRAEVTAMVQPATAGDVLLDELAAV